MITVIIYHYTVPEEQAERGGASGEAVTCPAPTACVSVSVRLGEKEPSTS